MKKVLCFVVVFLAMLTCGITLLSPKIQDVQAEVVGTDGAQFILTGYSGSSPKSYFTNSDDTSTLVYAQEKTPDKNYLNKSGNEVGTFYYLTGKHSSVSKAKSSGVCEIYPSVEMQKIISAGQMMVKGSAGLLSLDGEERSKVNITIQIVAGGEVYKTLTLTSDKVSSNDDIYEPDWVETELVVLPTNTEKIVYSFESREATNRLKAAKFCIFEPTVFFATNLSDCTISTQNQSVKAGQVLKLSASNLITRETSTSQYFEYYKNIHKVGFEITEGSNFAKIVDNYLYINSDMPFGEKVVVRAKCRKSSLSAEYIYSDTRTFVFDIESVCVEVDKDFSSPASILGEGDYFVGDYATLSIKENAGFEFVGWEIGGQIVSSEKSYTFQVEKDKQIKAKFIKTIRISKIVVKSREFDGTTNVVFEKIVLDGVENSHDVSAQLDAKFATSNIGENKTIEFLSVPTLVGKDCEIYEVENFIPTVTGTISQKSVVIVAHALSKTYGETDPVLSYDATGVVEGEQLLGGLSRIEGEDAGEYQIEIGNLISSNPDYKISFVGAKFTIDKREIVLSDIGVVSKVFDQNTSAQIYSKNSNIVSGDDVSLEFEAAFCDANAGTNKTVTISKISILGENSKNYFVNVAQKTLLGTISQKQVVVTCAEQTFTYGDEINIKYDVDGLLGDDKLTGALAISSNQVGRYVILIGTLKNANYSISLETNHVDIVAKNIVVVANNVTKSYGDVDPTLTYIAKGLVEGDVLGGQIVREEGEEVGEYKILIGTLHNDNYEIEFEAGIFEIQQRVIEIVFDIKDKIYDGTTNVEFSYEVKNTLEKDDVQLEIELLFPDKNVDAEKNIVVNKLEVVGANCEKYSINYNKNLLFASIFAKNVEIISNSTQKTYGEDDPEMEVEYDGVVEGDEIVGEISRVAGEDVGEYEYDISQSMKVQNSNYNLTLRQETKLVIVAKSIKVGVASSQKQFGDDDPKIEYTYDLNDLCFEDEFEDLLVGEAKREIGEEIGRFSYNAGTMKLGDNYIVDFEEGGILTIVKRDITVTANNVEKIYGEDDPEFCLTQENVVKGIASTIKLKREKGENVGTYKITYESLDDPHYNIVFTAGEFEILPCEISVKVEDAFKYYGEDDPTFDFVLYYGTLQFDDELSNILTGVVSRDPGENVGLYEINQGTLGAGSNYDMTFISGVLSVYAQELVVKLSDTCKYYGEDDPTFECVIMSGNADASVFSGKAKRQSGENVGEYIIDIGTLSTTLNYTFKYTCGTLTILPRKIEVTALPAVKIYGEDDPKFMYEITSGTLVEDNDLSGEIYRENVGVKMYENVGKYPLLSNLYNQNYEITYIGANLSITQREIVVSANDYSSVYGEEISTLFEYTLTGDILDGDTLTGGLYKTEGVEAGKYPIRCNINLGRNYKVKYNQAYYYILPRKLVVTLGINEKIYSNPDPIYSLQILEGDMVGEDVLEWEVQRDACEDVGDYVLTAASTDDNYELETRNSLLQILKKDVKLSLEVLDKPYDGTANCKIKNPIVSGLIDNEIVLDYDKNNCAMFTSIYPANDIEVTLLDFRLVGAKSNNYNLLLPENLFASITYSSIEQKNVEISTYNSTSMRYGTTLNVKDNDIGSEYNGKKVLQSLNVGLLDASGDTLAVDRALNMRISLNNLNNCNNIYVYGKDSSGKYVELDYKIVGDELVVSTAVFEDFIIVCDNENWIDIAVAVCVGMLLGIGLCILILDLKKKRKNK